MQTEVSTGVTGGGQRIGIPREVFPGEKRVATVPEVVEKLIKLGFAISVESGAGDAANFADDMRGVRNALASRRSRKPWLPA